VLIVLSDGSPAPTEYRNQIDAVAKLVKELEKRIEVYGIGICDDNVKYIYSKHQVLNDPQELPNVLFKLLERVIK
jgi:nitric oxide reductase activation protein